MQCARNSCRDYHGRDVVAGCFEQMQAVNGATAGDPSFIQDCTSLIACAERNECGFRNDFQYTGLDCYCGPRDPSICLSQGRFPFAVCVSEMETAVRSIDPFQVGWRFYDPEFPAGWATSFLRCARERCPAQCGLPAPICGNGEIEAAETCDDGNHRGGDGCSSQCQLESKCGNGKLDAGEECDDGNLIDGDGCTRCVIESVCGDGFVVAPEECDDGNDNPLDACNNECRLNMVECFECGKLSCRTRYQRDVVAGCLERVDPFYGTPVPDRTFLAECTALLECAERTGCGFADFPAGTAGVDCLCGSRSASDCYNLGPAPDAPCLAEAYAATRTMDWPRALLDFGNRFYPAGWASSFLQCTREVCAAQCGFPAIICGDGVVDYQELCDDGNLRAGDGCESDCRSIVPRPSLWGCGDGIVDWLERCDDGNNVNDDQCSSDCLVVTP